MKRGDVYYLRFDNSYGHEMAVGRPVVIVSADERINLSQLVQVVYLTTSRRDYDDCYKLLSGYRDSWACCNQLNTVDKNRLQDFQFHLTNPEMVEIDKRLKMVLGFDEVSESENVCQVEVAEPVNIEDVGEVAPVVDKSIELEVELTMYKKLYEKALEKFIDLKFEKDTRVEVVVKEPQVTVKKVVEPVLSNEEDELKQPEKPKRGRPPKKKVEEVIVAEKVPWRITRAEIEKYKKKSGKVNVNTDEWYVIAATTGMGIQSAQSIVAYRNKHGKFEKLEDLISVSRFGSVMLDRYGRMLEV